MEWKDLEGKKLFIRTRHGKVYSGIIESVNDDDKPIIFISMIDKFNKQVILVSSEIVEVKEEGDEC